MTKVFIVHGLHSAPNKAWRPWLMSELAKKEIYTCSLPMPEPAEGDPICNDWVNFLNQVIGSDEDIYLVGHSLGARAVLKFLESSEKKIKRAVIVSGRFGKPRSGILGSFYDQSINFDAIKQKSDNFVVIHGDDDPNVPYEDGKNIAEGLQCELITIFGGGHLSGKAGWKEFPQLRDVLLEMIK